ncbi:hypothetical protein MLD38_029930 [Melastoma candidum]|uniref:Uncharacterized protein n=1 Tax=Melastoma candidum TaxID=119954 RepID=A0ACB9MLE9_9MYRT|nr:hypothetical protein MLD38_029930 [Melastoma candidum]
MATHLRSSLVLPPDAEFWLPPQFLSDDEQAILPPVPSCGATSAGGLFFPPADYGNGRRNSTLTSPRDSVVGSTEESDNDEDFIPDLTRKFAQSTLGDDFPPLNSKGLYPSGSPKSTLCGACGCGRVLSRGIPNGLTHTKPVHPPTLDALYQAVGKVTDMRLCQQQLQADQARYLQQLQQRLNHLIRLHSLNPGVLHHRNQSSSHLSAMQLNHLLALGVNGSNDAKTDTGMSSSAWSALQHAQQTHLVHGNINSNGGSAGMRTVFLGSGNGARRGSTGTGVFLPRHAGASPEPKRKQGCSTVLIPAKVVQALNLNCDEMNPTGPLNSSLNRRPDSQVDGGRGQQAVISLPSEWTY